MVNADIKKNMQLIIAGGGSFDFAPYRTTKNISIINQFIQPEVLANYIKNSEIVICPYTDATQSGVVMSAYAFHKPIIATNVGGLPEMVIDGKTGIIIEPKDAPALRDAIIYLFKNKDVLEMMKNEIIEIYEKGSKSWDNAAKLFMNGITDVSDENHK